MKNDEANPKKKRAKHSPEERTSKIPPRALKEVKGIIKATGMRRDPRFDRTSGEFKEDAFENAYGFVYDYEKEELKSLEKKARKGKMKDAEMKREIESKKNRINARRQKSRRREIVREWKKSELALEKEGKKPYYLKKSDVKKIQTYEKYKDMVSKGKSYVEKYIEKKNKKSAISSKKSCPRV